MALSIIRFVLPRIQAGGAGAGAAARAAKGAADAAKDAGEAAGRAAKAGESLIGRMAASAGGLLEKLGGGVKAVGGVLTGAVGAVALTAGRALFRQIGASARKDAGVQRLIASFERLVDSIAAGILGSKVIQGTLAVAAKAIATTATWFASGGFDRLLRSIVVPAIQGVRRAAAVLDVIALPLRIVTARVFLALADLVQAILAKFPRAVAVPVPADQIGAQPRSAGDLLPGVGEPAAFSFPGSKAFDAPQNVASARTAEVVGLPPSLFDDFDALRLDLAARADENERALSDLLAGRRGLESFGFGGGLDEGTAGKIYDGAAAAVQAGWETTHEQVLSWTTSAASRRISSALTDVLVKIEGKLSDTLGRIEQTFRSFRTTFGTEIPALLEPVGEATEGFLRALTYTTEHVEAAAGQSGAAARALHAAKMAVAAATAIALAVKEVAAAVASWPNAGLMALHLAAAGLYGTAAALAVGGAVAGPPPVSREKAERLRRGLGGAGGGFGDAPRMGSLVVNIRSSVRLPDDDWFRANVLEVIASGGAVPPEGPDRVALPEFGGAEIGVAEVLGQLGRQFLREHEEAAVENALNSLFPGLGSALRWGSDAVEDIADFFEDLF